MLRPSVSVPATGLSQRSPRAARDLSHVVVLVLASAGAVERAGERSWPPRTAGGAGPFLAAPGDCPPGGQHCRQAGQRGNSEGVRVGHQALAAVGHGAGRKRCRDGGSDLRPALPHGQEDQAGADGTQEQHRYHLPPRRQRAEPSPTAAGQWPVGCHEPPSGPRLPRGPVTAWRQAGQTRCPLPR